jgi:hypothetical protein
MNSTSNFGHQAPIRWQSLSKGLVSEKKHVQQRPTKLILVGGFNPIYGKIKNDPNHQSVISWEINSLGHQQCQGTYSAGCPRSIFT